MPPMTQPPAPGMPGGDLKSIEPLLGALANQQRPAPIMPGAPDPNAAALQAKLAAHQGAPTMAGIADGGGMSPAQGQMPLGAAPPMPPQARPPIPGMADGGGMGGPTGMLPPAPRPMQPQIGAPRPQPFGGMGEPGAFPRFGRMR